MTQVVFNLLTNAIKYFQGSRDDFRVEIVAAKFDEHYELTFRDWGIGEPEEFREAVFEQRVRAPNAAASKIPGQGIGLWISERIIRHHGGRLWIGKLKEPTEFVLSLPERPGATNGEPE